MLALAVGLSREKLANQLRDWFGSGTWAKVARQQAAEMVTKLDEDYDLLRLLATQRGRTYSFADVLVARAGTRTTATSAAAPTRVGNVGRNDCEQAQERERKSNQAMIRHGLPRGEWRRNYIWGAPARMSR